MKKLDTPIKKNFVAYLLNVGVNLLNQIVLVHFYLAFWKIELYSDWIVLTAITVFFSMSDTSLNTVIQNRFSMSLSQNKYQECQSLIVCNVFLVTIIFLLSIFVSILYLNIFDITDNMNLIILNREDASSVFFILILGVFIRMYAAIENSIFRAFHKNNICVLIDTVTNLSIFVITLLCVMCGFSVVMLSVFVTIPSLVSIRIKHYYSKRYFEYSISYKNIDFGLLKDVFKASVSFMFFPLGYAVLIQGFTLVVNKYLGANSVVQFNTTRTMCNFLKTLTGTIQNSIWPEFSIAYGKKNYVYMHILLYKVVVYSLAIVLLVSLVLFLFGPLIYKLWLKGEVEFNYSLMLSFLIVLFFSVLWNTNGITLYSTNNHLMLSVYFLLLSILSLLVSIVLISQFKLLILSVYSMLIVDLSLSIYTVKYNCKFVNSKIINQ